MKIRVVEKNLFLIPELNGNKELPVSEQIKVDFSSLPEVYQKKKYKKLSQKLDGSMSIEYDYYSMVINHVSKIHNFDVNGKIETPMQLLESKYSYSENLIDEIKLYLMEDDDEITEGEEKASE